MDEATIRKYLAEADAHILDAEVCLERQAERLSNGQITQEEEKQLAILKKTLKAIQERRLSKYL
jgi:hypothetical protein